MIYTYIVNIYHTALHPMQCCLIHNSKFQGFTTLQQTLSNITHKSSLLTLKINPHTPNSCTHWYKSLYQWWYEQTFAFYESCSKTRFYYYFLSFYLYMSNIIIIIIIMVLFFLALILLLLFTLLLLLWILFMLTLMWVDIMLYRLSYYSNLLLCDF